MVSIVATKGAEDANSYVDVETADSFFASIHGADEWLALTEDVKASLLITATLSVDDLPVAYNRQSGAQALKFPVTIPGATDDGFKSAQKACLWQALYLMKNGDVIEEALTGSIQGIRSESMGPTSKSVGGFNPLMQWGPRVMSSVGKYVDFTMKTIRG